VRGCKCPGASPNSVWPVHRPCPTSRADTTAGKNCAPRNARIRRSRASWRTFTPRRLRGEALSRVVDPPETEFSGVVAIATQYQLHVERSCDLSGAHMSNTSVKAKVAIALLLVLATPAASFARGGGGRGGGTVGMGGSRPNAGLGAQIGAAGMLANSNRVGNAPTVAAPPPPRISVPAIPQFK
jgi:hypothetical protein